MAAHGNIRIRLLGQLTLLRDGASVPLATRKAAALLAVLALRPGAVVPRERLCGLLWSRSAPEQARASLRQALPQLRRDLDDSGPALIASEGDGVRLRVDGVKVDTAALESGSY